MFYVIVLCSIDSLGLRLISGCIQLIDTHHTCNCKDKIVP